MKLRIFLVLMLTMVATVGGCDKDMIIALPAGGFVQGVVIDRDSSAPIDSVFMRLATDPAGKYVAFKDEYTDSSGSYLLFSGVHTGDLYVVTTKTSYKKRVSHVFVIESDTVRLNLSLEK
jgi:hypothetical protein